MGRAVAERTILRKCHGDVWESWLDVSHRVAVGNANLLSNGAEASREFFTLFDHLKTGACIMSGRHLQHGDGDQPSRPKEVFTNCATSAASFITFMLLLSGSGVGRSYDDDMIMVDWDNAPNLRVVLSQDHPDFDWSAHESSRDALHKYGPDSKNVTWFKVPDSREGWAKALEVWEVMAFEKVNRDKMLILDFSDVRCKGSPIKGMQNRPASGPVSLMNAFMKAASLKGSGMAPWKQAMYVDHYFSECVLVGGARRAARMSTKTWRDISVLDFIRIKRPMEFEGKDVHQVVEFRKQNPGHWGFLWSSNNSVTVDAEFWRLIDLTRKSPEYGTPLARHARKVWKMVMSCSYGDGTGEPGLINADMLKQDDTGWDELTKGTYVGSKWYQVEDDTEVLLKKLAKRARAKKNYMITNPCGEIALSVLGGYCVIADVVPFHCESLQEVESAFRTAVRAMIRTNTMDCLYKAETDRTNRIGVGITGIHEFAWKFFGVGFRDLINPDFEAWDSALYMGQTGGNWPQLLPHGDNYWSSRISPMSGTVRAAAFWRMMEYFNGCVKDEARKYSKHLGVRVPHTALTVKPSGTVSKLFGLTEGWHLPAMAYYLRWVQFRNDDPLVKTYQEMGYPTRSLKTYEGTIIVGFPTAPIISTLGMGNELVLAGEATPEEQYKWLELGEKYWIKGKGEDLGNQISYTLKYDPEKVDFAEFCNMIKKYQRNVRCCSVMPQEKGASYEYLPEEQITRDEYDAIMIKVSGIAEAAGKEMGEEVDKVHLECEGGACPIDFKEREKELA